MKWSSSSLSSRSLSARSRATSWLASDESAGATVVAVGRLTTPSHCSQKLPAKSSSRPATYAPRDSLLLPVDTTSRYV